LVKKNNPSMAKRRVLIIGCGSIGERHLRCFQQTGRVDVTACESNPALLQKMAETYKVPTMPDWEKAVDGGKFDVVVVCTPAQFHIPMSIRAMRAGSHVLVEKPLSISMQGVNDLLRARQETGRQIAVGYTSHMMPFLGQAREFLRSGELGPVLQATVVSGQAFHLHRPAYAQVYYRSHASGGGAIQDALTHSANWMESVVGPADSLICDCAHLSLAGVEVEDTVHIAARHGPILVSYALNQFQMPNEHTVQLNTAKGSVKIESHRQRWGVARENNGDWTWREAPVPHRDNHYIAQASAFLDLVEGQPSRLCSVEAAAQTLRFNLAALASAKTGSRVFCRDFHE
jgi:predicted dehydrogenase